MLAGFMAAADGWPAGQMLAPKAAAKACVAASHPDSVRHTQRTIAAVGYQRNWGQSDIRRKAES